MRFRFQSISCQLKAGDFRPPQARSGRPEKRKSALRLLHEAEDCHGLLGRQNHSLVIGSGRNADLFFPSSVVNPVARCPYFSASTQDHHHDLFDLAEGRPLQFATLVFVQ